MSEGQRQGQKRKKSYYVQSYNKKGASRLHALEPGMRGFLITCNNREREAVREAYNLLNEYADQLYGQEHKVVTSFSLSAASKIIALAPCALSHHFQNVYSSLSSTPSTQLAYLNSMLTPTKNSRQLCSTRSNPLYIPRVKTKAGT